jgi:DNA replication and repair protein RecF
MRLESIKLENFRNYEKVEVKVNSDLVLVLGENASGKTNLLESIYFLSQLKSFRVPDQFLVRTGADFFSLRASLNGQKIEAIVRIRPPVKRSFKIDELKVSRNFWQSFRTVLFVPSDLNLFTLGPQARRKFLDETLSQKSQEYAFALASLDHVLKQKAALLESLNHGQGEPTQLDFWNEQLAAASLVICTERLRFLKFIDSTLNKKNRVLTGFKMELRVEYKSQITPTDKQLIVDRLNQARQSEISSQMNLVGPHRDDFFVSKDGIGNIYNSSRGELRAQILALKLLQAEYLSDEKQKPVILLDDVFSELDETRRTKLLENLVNHQIFITTTEEHHLPKLNEDALVLKIENNDIKNPNH